MPKRIRELANQVVKGAARIILGEYSAYYIYSWTRGLECPITEKTSASLRVQPINLAEIEASSEQNIRDQAKYAGPEALAYGCYDGNRLVGICFYWFGSRYETRNFLTLKKDQAKLVQLFTIAEMRNQGVGKLLISESCKDMTQKGFNEFKARVWHSNIPSLRAFSHAGWKREQLIIEINPWRSKKKIRINCKSGYWL